MSRFLSGAGGASDRKTEAAEAKLEKLHVAMRKLGVQFRGTNEGTLMVAYEGRLYDLRTGSGTRFPTSKAPQLEDIAAVRAGDVDD